MKWSGKTYWIVGASEGLGRELSIELARCGARLVISARNEDRLRSLAAELPTDTVVKALDVRDSDGVQAAYSELPPLDGVVFAAGVYDPMRAQDWAPKKVEAMCDVNLTGAARVLGCVVPDMVTRGGGHIVVIGSLAGYRGLPHAIGYGASKAGLMSLAESMRTDLPSPAFNVQSINPGFIRTRLTDKNTFKMPFLMEPEDAARRVRKAMETRRFRTDFPRRFSILLRVFGALPDAIYFRIT